MKPRTRIKPISAKRAAAQPELLRAGRTVLSSSSPKRSVSKKGGKVIAESTKRIRPNAKRQAKNHERAYGSKRAWIASLDCAVCRYEGPSEAAHVKGDGGMGHKSSSRYLVPLCGPRTRIVVRSLLRQEFGSAMVEGCHRASHRMGVKTFEKDHNVSLVALAAKYEAEWVARMDEQGVRGGE